MSNLRKEKRDECLVAAALISECGNIIHQCNTEDISGGGIRVETEYPLDHENYYIYLLQEKLSGKIVYKEKSKSSITGKMVFHYGLQFLEHLSEAMSRTFLSECRLNHALL